MSQSSYLLFQDNFSKSCLAAGRKLSDVEVLAVSKGQEINTLIEALKIKDFPLSWGENYLGELESKTKRSEFDSVTWHYLGALQSRKIDDALKCASCLQGVSREKELEIISKNIKNNPALHDRSFYIQVNISDDAQKLGASFDQIEGLLQYADKLGLLHHVTGFMGVATDLEKASESVVRKEFSKLRELREKLLPRAKLSMGMSSDYKLAILEGSDMIRVGTLLFGERNYT